MCGRDKKKEVCKKEERCASFVQQPSSTLASGKQQINVLYDYKVMMLRKRSLLLQNEKSKKFSFFQKFSFSDLEGFFFFLFHLLRGPF